MQTESPYRGTVLEWAAKYELPPALLLALIDYESGGDPSAVNPASGAAGLMQITAIVLKDYNNRHGTKWTRRDLLDPSLNIAMGAELLSRIAKTYASAGLKVDWRSRPFVGLVVLGWNAGYSKKAGVARVVSELKAAGKPISAAAVQAAAVNMDGVSPYLKNEKRLGWSQRVTTRYMGPKATGNGNGKPGESAPGQKKPRRIWPWVVGGAAAVAGIAWMTSKKSTTPATPAELPPAPGGYPNPYGPSVVVVKGS